MSLFEELKFDAKTGQDHSLFGALAADTTVDFRVCIDRAALPAGKTVRSVRMVLHADGWNTGKTEYRSFELEKIAGDGVAQFRIRVDLSALLRSFRLDGEGLFYYHYAVTCSDGDFSDEVFYLGGEAPTALTTIENFVGERQLLVYRAGYVTAQAFREGVIYHIFVDRFATSGRCGVKARAVFDPDWDNGIPQYGEYPGAPVANNVFFGGDLYGIAEKMDYIASLGVKTIYLSPIFDAYSNHKYDTADYLTVDAMFGGADGLRCLCDAARAHGIAILLDGVFNHTGADSVYFNKFGYYDTLGAYQSKESPYYPWYAFRDYPDDYECWWGVQILPRIRSEMDEVRRFVCGEVVPKWMRAGVSGWRLDVADELAESFLDDFRTAVKEENPDAVVIGEVWEDASDKVSYGRRRRYLGGGQLDSVMNYPLRSALIDYVKTGACDNLRRYTEGTYRRYPKASSDTLMNFLGTHDTERILTLLGGVDMGEMTNEQLSTIRMSGEERAAAKKKLMLAYGILAGLPGVPCVFYGDEVGLEGYRDPFCRMPFPWKRMDRDLVAHYRKIGQIRHDEVIFRDGLFRLLRLTPESVVYSRTALDGTDAILVAACRTGELTLSLPDGAVSLTGHGETLYAGDVAYYRIPAGADIHL